jgi:hypothetical protein
MNSYRLKRSFFILSLLLIFANISVAQTPKLTAAANATTIDLGSALTVTFSLTNGQSESFQRPNFTGFTVVGSSKSSGGGMTIIVNGQVMQSGNGEEKWIYQIAPSAIGKYTIEPAKVKVKGQMYSSNALTIEVTNSGGSAQKNKNQKQDAPKTEAVSGNDIFIKASVNKSSPFQGEQITLTYKIYTKIAISQYAINKVSSYAGFWTHDLMKEKEQPKQYQETVNGEKYMVAEIRRIAMFPQKSGKLTLEPLEVECLAQIKVKSKNNAFNQFFNDPFFSDPFFSDPFSTSYQTVKKVVKSNPLTINVVPLPSGNVPQEFTGSVGNFTMKSEIDRSELKANEAVNLKITITGKGNLNLIDQLTTEFPSDFEVYDPKTNDNISVTNNEVSGSRTFEYLIIPRNPGVFKIKPVKFCYFDLSRNSYNTLSTPEYTIKVAKGSGTGNTVYSTSKEDIKYIGSDIRYLINKPFSLKQKGYFFFNSLLYYILLLIPLVAFIVFVVIRRKQLKLKSNVSLLKLKRATKVALKRLKTAEAFLRQNNRENFYIEISKALWGYIGDKFSMPLSTISIESVIEKLQSGNINEEVINSLNKVLNDCEYARFAPADETVKMEVIYKEAVEIISKIEQNLK